MTVDITVLIIIFLIVIILVTFITVILIAVILIIVILFVITLVININDLQVIFVSSDRSESDMRQYMQVKLSCTFHMDSAPGRRSAH